MARSLCISATFLQPVYHGRTDNGREGEWPPSPMRLFQALTAAAFGGCAPRAQAQTLRSALRWLEEQSQRCPPEVVAAPAIAGAPCVLFVPNNDLDIVARAWAQKKRPPKEPAELKTAKVMRPHHLEEPAQVHFVWPMDDDANPAEAKTLCRLARRIVVLGWGTDLVACEGRILDASEFASLGGQRWCPQVTVRNGSAAATRRVPVAGSLADLERRHLASLDSMNAGVYTKPPALAVFGEVRYRQAGDDLQSRPFAAFALRPVIDPAIAELDTPEGRDERRKSDRYRAFRQANAAKVAAMLRHAACEAALKDGAWPFDEESARYVAGHGQHATRRSIGDSSPRFSYLPLPTAGTPHADGMIRRVLVAEPFGGDGSHAPWAMQHLTGLDLIDETSNKAVATLHRLDADDGVLRMFTGIAREWITATPIVLPGFDDLKTDKATALLCRACDQAGLPPGSVESFEFIGPPARGDGRFFVPAYLRGLPLRHVVIRFTHEARGPIAIGAGRHCGLGILAVHPPRA